jgi:hypothetical protein
MKRVPILLGIAVIIAMIAGCAAEGPDPDRVAAGEDIHYDVPDKVEINYEVLDNIDVSQTELGVVPLPVDIGATLTGLFTKYTKILAPNGKPIHIFGQSGVRDLQMVRAREILEYHLTDVPGSKYGSEKTATANRMGDVRATLIYTDTEAHAFAMYDILEPSKLALQDLYATESPVEGDYEYVHNAGQAGKHFSRDASYEEIMHLVHAKGLEDELPDYHEAIVEAEKRAVEAGNYNYGPLAPHEYIITGFDIYFGLWDHNPQGDGTSFGDEYPFHTKDEMKAGDPDLYDLVEGFWPDTLTYTAFIAPEFEGTFSIAFDEATEYTLKSRYLVNVTLTGESDTGILGNDRDNHLTGNDGDNRITGAAGDDVIDGGPGHDAVVYTGDAAEYLIERGETSIVVTDSMEGRDGRDELTGVEVLAFNDTEM